MTKIVQKTATLQSLQTCQLTKEQVYRLLKCAIKDDDRLVDALIQKIYDTMIAFDYKRAEIVIGLIVDRHEAAEPAFQDFLRDINAVGRGFIDRGFRARSFCALTRQGLRAGLMAVQRPSASCDPGGVGLTRLDSSLVD